MGLTKIGLADIPSTRRLPLSKGMKFVRNVGRARVEKAFVNSYGSVQNLAHFHAAPQNRTGLGESMSRAEEKEVWVGKGVFA